MNIMMTIMVIFCLVVLVALVLVNGIVPRRASLSLFELERRAASDDKRAEELLRRERMLGDVLSIQRIVVALLLVVFVALAVVTFGWLFGIVVAVIVALEYGAVSHWGFVKRTSQKLYEKHEAALLRLLEKIPGVLRWIRSAMPAEDRAETVDSREELQHVIEESHGVLTNNEKKLILHSLQFDDRLVSEIMTPRGVIDSISGKELLGPLVLDDLHKTGHSRFPVTDGDIDHVVGMLHIRNLLALEDKRSWTAGKTMEPRVFYIREDQTLSHALAAFLRTHHHLFIVVNEFRETVGLLSLEDTIEALLGRKIVDEFDQHDDLRAVAKRNPRGNNHPEKREDV